jgi:PAS domain S-box-containing protein
VRLLVVDQDSVVRREVVSHLALQGVAVTTAATVAAAREELERATFDVAILSIALPDGSGLEILRMLRGLGSPIHVIVLSGKSEEDDRVDALELGADDYVVKPFFVRELTARILAVQRHQPAYKDRQLTYGAVSIDLASRTLEIDDVAINLTAMEFDLLAFLATRPGHTFSRDALLQAVWHSSGDWQRASTVTEHIRRLRAKLDADPSRPALLRTVRGSGYRFEPPPVDHPRQITPTSAGDAPSLEGTFIVVDGRVVSADETTVELFGVTTEADLIGRDELELVAPQSITALRARRDARAAGFSPGSQIVAIRNPDGTDGYVELSSSPGTWEHQPALVKTVRLSLEEGADLRRIVTGVVTEMSDAVIVTDPHFHIRSWNEAAQRFYGWAEHEVVGRRVDDVLRIAGTEAARSTARQTLAEKGRWFGELSVIARDGSIVNVSTTSTLVRDDAGHAVLVTGVHRLAVAASTLDAMPSTVATDEAELRRGLERDEFVATYEPIVTLEGRRVVAVEASAHWNHPELGLVVPAEVSDPKEHGAAMLEIERVIFERACLQTVIWRRSTRELVLAIHLSNSQLADTTLFDDITATLAKTHLDPRALWLEVTETALVEDIELAVDLLHRFASVGVRVAVDNFGIGWASFAYLKQLPVHALKIDRHFVAGVARDHQAAAIAGSIISLGRELGLAVVATGVETAAQHAGLQALGSPFGQGSWYGPSTTALDVQ